MEIVKSSIASHLSNLGKEYGLCESLIAEITNELCELIDSELIEFISYESNKLGKQGCVGKRVVNYNCEHDFILMKRQRTDLNSSGREIKFCQKCGVTVA